MPEVREAAAAFSFREETGVVPRDGEDPPGAAGELGRERGEVGVAAGVSVVSSSHWSRGRVL